MGTPSLLDSNIAIYLIKGGLDYEVEQKLRNATLNGSNLSVITKIEILGFAFPTNEIQAKTERFIINSNILPLNDEIVEKTIEIRRIYKIKLPDALIAATAIVFDLTLVSRNDKDFTQIPELKYINPFNT
jgi:predicted nucleic acid-binding protein